MAVPELYESLVGRNVSHYRVLARPGGGMGVVRREEDTTLGRAAALKFLPDAVLSATGRIDEARDTLAEFENTCDARSTFRSSVLRFTRGWAKRMPLSNGSRLRFKIAPGASRISGFFPLLGIAARRPVFRRPGQARRHFQPADLCSLACSLDRSRIDRLSSSRFACRFVKLPC
jgi:hypothetical protein